MDEMKEKLIEALLKTVTYADMNEEQEKLVAEYETIQYTPKVDELLKQMPLEKVEEQIHEWWLDYEIADTTEENLLDYAESKSNSMKK